MQPVMQSKHPGSPALFVSFIYLYTASEMSACVPACTLSYTSAWVIVYYIVRVPTLPVYLPNQGWMAHY